MKCRHCERILTQLVADLGLAPISNYYPLRPSEKIDQEVYPLRVYVCSNCWLVQTVETISREKLFAADYPYFSSVSDSWLKHSKDFALQKKKSLGLSGGSLVVEIGSNDGYLLRNFLEMGIPCLGIEPTLSTAIESRKLGIPTLDSFFGMELAEEIVLRNGPADLVVANNVIAHVPDINDFVGGISRILSTNGSVSVEFPHILQMMTGLQFDTIYHEHYSYFSLLAIVNIFNVFGLRVYDVEIIETHGGSLRVSACHENAEIATKMSVENVLAEEDLAGLHSLDGYKTFQKQIEDVKANFLKFVAKLKLDGQELFAYGAAAKGVTFLNFCGLTSEDVRCVFDLAPSKQGRFLPISDIPIFAPKEIDSYKPRFLLILPWNIKEEIIRRQSQIYSWGGEFVTAIPKVQIW